MKLAVCAATTRPNSIRDCAACGGIFNESSRAPTILAAYGQAVDRKQNPNDPTGPLNHTLRVFLVDASGNVRNLYSSSTLDPRLVLADVRTLMLEEAKPPTPQPNQ